MKKVISIQNIIDCLKIYYNIEIARLVLLPLGADTNASVYKVYAKNQSTYFIKLKHSSQFNHNFSVIELLQNAQIQQIIPPIKTLNGQATHNMDDYTIIAYPFVEAQDGFSQSLTKEQWFILGKTLRQIHAIKVPSSIQKHIQHEKFTNKWRQWCEHFVTR